MRKKKMCDIPIGRRLVYGYIGILAIFLLTVIINIGGITTIKTKFENFYNKSHVVTVATVEVRSTLNAIEKITTQYVYNVIDKEEIKQEVENLVSTMQGKLDLIQQGYLGDKENVEQLLKEYTEVIRAREEIFKLVDANNYEEAEKKLKNEYRLEVTHIRELADKMSMEAEERAKKFYNASVDVVNNLYIIVAFASLGVVGAIFGISKAITKSIVEPIEEVESVAKDLSKGILSTQISYSGKDEIGRLAVSMNDTVESLQLYISDIAKQLDAMANGNMTKEITIDYVGDFNPIKEGLVKICDKLNETLKNIAHSAEEVSDGSGYIAKGATELAQGVTEQASIIEEFVASTEEISNNIAKTVDKINETNNISIEARQKADEGTMVMKKMLESMDDISKTSESIAEVIQIIDSIAQQTNLLALNAAIESARAGEAGRGFAVVANEIRDLANRSSETVKEIENMVKASLKSVEEGQEMAHHTSDALEKIVDSVEKTAEIASELLESSKQQKEAIEQLEAGVKQINDVVESNSSTSEESAAISEELAAQAESLKGLIEYFKLKA